jgi:hypothetical protein
MRQLDCQGQFGWVVACLLILRLPACTDEYVAGDVRVSIVAPIPMDSA